MIGVKSVLAVIPARGGSKGLPRKNVLAVGGKPLIAWTILAAQASRTIDRTVLSSEDEEIIAVAQEWGCDIPFTRPAALADDTTPMEDVLLHALDALEQDFDLLVLLQPTSPLRTAEDIDATVKFCAETGCPAVITVCETAKSPYWMFHVDEDGGQMSPVIEGERPTRRQELPRTYAPNGAVYVVDVVWFRKHRKLVTAETRAWPMSPERSVDIDGAIDLAVAETLMKATGGKLSAAE